MHAFFRIVLLYVIFYAQYKYIYIYVYYILRRKSPTKKHPNHKNEGYVYNIYNEKQQNFK